MVTVLNEMTAADDIIRRLSKEFSRQADTLLDLRNWLSQLSCPGECVECFYRLYEQASGPATEALEPLRNWLESHIEVVAQTGEENLLESLPVELHEPDLESFCTRLMSTIRFDRVYREDRVILNFRYKPEIFADTEAARCA